MIMDWQSIRWEADDAGTSRATLTDNELNSLIVEHSGDKVTFHTEGSPSFDAAAALDIAALCVAVSKNALGRSTTSRRNRKTATTMGTGGARPRIPGQRRIPAANSAARLPETLRAVTQAKAEWPFSANPEWPFRAPFMIAKASSRKATRQYNRRSFSGAHLAAFPSLGPRPRWPGGPGRACSHCSAHGGHRVHWAANT
jgi:hypothetical protein